MTDKDKLGLLKREWNSFSSYPEQGAAIMVHIKGFDKINNKVYHSLQIVENFNSRDFDVRDYTPDKRNVAWTYDWLPLDEVI